MKKIKITIERAKDGFFSAYAENVEGVYGAGNTAQEAKESALEGIRLLVANNDPRNIPAILKGNYEIAYRFDAESLLNYYRKIFSKPGLEAITGINQKQLHHYATGLKKPRPAQAKKIEKALHELGAELTSVEL